MVSDSVRPHTAACDGNDLATTRHGLTVGARNWSARRGTGTMRWETAVTTLRASINRRDGRTSRWRGRWRPPVPKILARTVVVATLATVLGLTAVLVAVAPMTQAREQSPAQFSVWRSPQFSLSLSYPTTWTIVEERSDLERGDVLILGNETSALLVGLLHDTRTPREMADDLVMSQKAQTPDLAVVQSEVTSAGSILMFLQYTIDPGTNTAMLIDEKALVGTLQPGSSTITLRGMVPDHADVEAEFEELELIIGTLGPDA